MKSRNLLDGISTVALPLGFAIIVFTLWQTEILHSLIGTDTITLPLPTRVIEIIGDNTEVIGGHVKISLRNVRYSYSRG